MSGFDSPRAMRSSTSRSRSVSSGKASGAGLVAGRENDAMTRLAIAGLKIDSPSATAWIARASCSWPAPLST